MAANGICIVELDEFRTKKMCCNSSGGVLEASIRKLDQSQTNSCPGRIERQRANVIVLGDANADGEGCPGDGFLAQEGAATAAPAQEEATAAPAQEGVTAAPAQEEATAAPAQEGASSTGSRRSSSSKGSSNAKTCLAPIPMPARRATKQLAAPLCSTATTTREETCLSGSST